MMMRLAPYWLEADAVSDETVTKTFTTPDQNFTEDLEEAVGLGMDDSVLLRINEILKHRDDRRWELESMSCDAYQERRD